MTANFDISIGFHEESVGEAARQGATHGIHVAEGRIALTVTLSQFNGVCLLCQKVNARKREGTVLTIDASVMHSIVGHVSHNSDPTARAS